MIEVQATVNGVSSIKGLEKYRVQSPVFNFTLGRNNILGLPVQAIATQAVSDGFLKSTTYGYACYLLQRRFKEYQCYCY
ncbi:MAG: hypothetical protein WCF23_03865 [Candidatus Nitrosopolaris sp.]